MWKRVFKSFYIINYIIVALLIIFLIIFNFSKIENQKNLLIFYFTTVFVLFFIRSLATDYLKEKNYQNIQINLDKKSKLILKILIKHLIQDQNMKSTKIKKMKVIFLNVTPSNYLGQNKQILPLSEFLILK